MAEESAKKFLQKVSEDKALQKILEEKGKAYKGDPSDIEEVIRQSVLPVAEELGFSFTPKEYQACLTPAKENGALPDDDLGAVVGGSGDIYAQSGGDLTIIDLSTTVSTYVVLPGADLSSVAKYLK